MNRRDFLAHAGGTLAVLATPVLSMMRRAPGSAGALRPITLFLCGDVMTGRGIDQILTQPSDPRLHESYVRDARRYVELAEARNGPIPRRVQPSYLWGDVLDELERLAPDVRIVNLETAVTTSDDYWPGKGINYRMHPGNVSVLTTAMIDCCALANNHVLDWGYQGLAETLATLRQAGVKTAGAGLDREQAEAPAILNVPDKGRVLVFSFGSTTSGIPAEWAATPARAGVNLLHSLSDPTIHRISEHVAAVREPGDVVVASIHWGSNWGYAIPPSQRTFAHRLIDEAGVDVVHGHSSHHPRPLEVYRGRPILYGCGDFLNDYEGIGGYEEYRGDLALMYFARLDPRGGGLTRCTMTPTRIRRFRLERASRNDALWLQKALARESRTFGTEVVLGEDNSLTVRWQAGASDR